MSFVEKVDKLLEMVNEEISKEEVIKTLMDNQEDIELAANELLHVVMPKEKTFHSVSDLVGMKVEKTMQLNEDLRLTVNREEVWKCALTFYKTANVHPQRLKLNLQIEFESSGELGLDGGALRAEFFQLVFKEVDWRLFEGEENQRIPRKGCDNIALFKLVGNMMSHAVMLKCPILLQFPEWLYDILITGDPSSAVEKVTMEDIPQNAGNQNLLSLISILDAATTDKAIDDILDKDVNLEIVNQSMWPVEKAINMQSKHSLIHQLIIHEVIFQRMPQVSAIREGLKALGLLEMVIHHPDLCHSLFVVKNVALTADLFLDKLSPQAKFQQSDPVKKQAQEWFFKYIREKGPEESEDFTKGRLVELFRFCTGHAAPSPLVSTGIDLKYLEDDEAKVLPEAVACVGQLSLPTVHTSYNSFIRYMDTALKFGAAGFGNY